MDCNEAEELLGPYVLGALDSGARWLVESHLEACPPCSLRLQGEGEALARVASAVPQLEVPPRVKRRLLSRIEADQRQHRRAEARKGLSRLRAIVRGAFRPHPAMAVAPLLVVGLVIGGIWFNSKLNRVSKETNALSSRMEKVVEFEGYVSKMVSDQRYLTSMTAAPGVSVKMLWGNESSNEAWGMIACCAVSDRGILALLAVANLPRLPSDRVYQVWLLKDGQRYSAGVFSVDATGFGQTLIASVAPFHEFDAIRVTIEPAQGSAWPTGTKVLDGDL